MSGGLRPEFDGPDGGVLVCDVLLTPAQALRPGWVHITGAHVTAVGAGVPPRPPSYRLPAGSTITPGFVDTHVHGGGGHTMTAPDSGEVGAATAYHLCHGTTATLVSLVTAPLPRITDGLALVADLAGRGRAPHGHILGSHLEGPYLSFRRRGAHPPAHLLQPATVTTRTLLDAGRGTLRMLTLAPELPGTLRAGGLLRQLGTAGVTAALGHTDATYETTKAALADGASTATHLFNGMRPLHHREPGPIGAVLEDDRVVCELINDGVHVHPTVARLTVRAAGRGHLVLITDAVAATGAPDGDYRLGEEPIVRRDGVIRSADGSTLGGADITLADAVRRAVGYLGLSVVDAVAAATSVPAAAVGCGAEVGSLASGRWADLVVLDADLNVDAVMLAGSWIRRPAMTDPAGHSSSSTSVQPAPPGAVAATRRVG